MPASIPYPHARQDDVHDNYHGTLVADPYRWLEDDHSPDTQAWVAVQKPISQQKCGVCVMALHVQRN